MQNNNNNYIIKKNYIKSKRIKTNIDSHCADKEYTKKANLSKIINKIKLSGAGGYYYTNLL